MTTPHINRRTILMGGLAMAAGAHAQTNSGPWPSRPIRLIVAGPPGVGGDIFARLIAKPLGETLKTNIVIENKPGANGLIASDAAAKSAGDGYTFLFAPSSAILINPIIQAKMPYDPDKDLVPVSQVGAAGILLVANPSTGFKKLSDMVAYAKANPGKLSYGSWGNGSSGHLAMEGIKARYGLDMVHIPYKSLAAEVTDLIGDNLKVGFVDIASPIPHIQAGRLNALGTTGSRRWPATKDVPSLTEQGFPFDADGWYGVFAPAGTPQDIVDRVATEVNRIQQSAETGPQIEAKNMIIPPVRTAKQFAETVKADAKLWQGLAKNVDLKEK